MARIVIRRQYSGHDIFTGIETRLDSAVVGGTRIDRPYCGAEDVLDLQLVRLHDPGASRQEAARSPGRRVRPRDRLSPKQERLTAAKFPSTRPAFEALRLRRATSPASGER